MKFEYRARTKSGEDIQNVIEAQTAEIAILMILQKQLYPLELRILSRHAETTYKKLDYLTNLKTSLEKRIGLKSANVEIQPKSVPELTPTITWQLDWLYIIFLIGCSALTCAALWYGQ